MLGINLDNKFKLKQQALDLNKKLCSSLPLFYSLKDILPYKIKLLLYNSLCLSHMNYCNLLYIISNKQQQSMINKTLNKCKRILKLKNLPSFHTNINILIKLNASKFLHSIIHKPSYCTPVSLHILLNNISKSKIHPFNFQLYTYKSSGTHLLNSLFIIWNSLPEHIKCIKSTQAFNILIRQHFM